MIIRFIGELSENNILYIRGDVLPVPPNHKKPITLINMVSITRP